jgi:hypothetical protein
MESDEGRWVLVWIIGFVLLGVAVLLAVSIVQDLSR